jgi:hypothetical protein
LDIYSRVGNEESRYWTWPLHIFFAVLPPPHGGYITLTEKPARAERTRGRGGFLINQGAPF